MRAPVRFGAAVAALGLTVAIAGAAPPKKAAQPRYGFPPLRAGQFWVTSVPVGVEVYAGPAVKGKPLGRTPLLLTSKQVGTHLTFNIVPSEYGGNLPHQLELIEPSAQNTHSLSISFPDHEEDRSRGITYKVDPSKRRTLIALFQSRSGTLSDWARRYPPGVNFRFRDEPVKADLASLGVPSIYLADAIRLLHRGGKIALPARDGWVAAEVTPSGQVEVTPRRSASPTKSSAPGTPVP